MSDQDQVDQSILTDDVDVDERTAVTDHTSFQLACDFVDDEIDAVDHLSDLSIEALVVLAVLRIVRHPDEFRVNITRASRMVVIELDVHESDLGPVIGKYGHTADSLRAIARAAAADSGVEYDIVPLEKGKPPPPRSRRYSRDRFSGGRREGRTHRRSRY